MIVVDTNVLIDVGQRPSEWRGWSQATLHEWSKRGSLIINDVIYAEVSVGFSEPGDLDDFLRSINIRHRELPRDALFRAGKAFRDYRRRRGRRTGVLPDFFIGAHAEVLGVPVLTRDGARYRSYFPNLALVHPAA